MVDWRLLTIGKETIFLTIRKHKIYRYWWMCHRLQPHF